MLEDWSTVLPDDPMRAYRAKRDAARRTVQSKYAIQGFISSGTYGRVYKASSTSQVEGENKLYAIKKFKPDKEGEVITYTGISQSAIREIALNREISHENVVTLTEVILEDKSIYMVFEYAEHDFLQLIHHHSQNLRLPIPPAVFKSLIYQLLNGVLYLHTCHILHRDLKPANILITSSGVVKIGDLGLARLTYEPLQPLFVGDKVVVTIWYRAPELLMGARHYNKAVDIWAVGCVMAELASLRPIFKGEEAKLDSKKNVRFQRDQLLKIFEILGTPDASDWPGLKNMPEYQNMKKLDHYKDRLHEWCHNKIRQKEGYDLLRKLFAYDPDKRLTAKEALQHKWFQEEPCPTRNVFYTISGPQIPPARRITQDEASASMQLPPNQNPTQQQLHPHHQQQHPQPHSQHQHPQQGSGTAKAGSTTSFASGGFGSVAGAGVGAGTVYGNANVNAGYANQAGLTRLPVGHSGGSGGPGDAANVPPRKKTRLG